MCPDTTIFFTHIPKTSGTSFKETLLHPNIPDSANFKYRDKRQWLTDISSCKIVTGHFKFGLHNFFRRKPRYITFLREPLDRAVSHYYFIKDCDPKKYLHPLRNIADSLSLEDFYSQNMRLQNLQTNYIAGYFASEMHNRFPWLFSSKMLLEFACLNLRRYYIAYGLQERFEDSIQHFMSILDWKKRYHVEPKKSTKNRPSVSDLDTHVKRSLKQTHELDIIFYKYACENFPM